MSTPCHSLKPVLRFFLFSLNLGLCLFLAGCGPDEDVSLANVDSVHLADTTSYWKVAKNLVEAHPLMPPRTDSPRSTLESFLQNMNASYRILQHANEANKKLRSWGVHPHVQNDAYLAERLFLRAVSCLDLEAYPEALKDDIGYEKALQLKEVLDRVTVPALDSIPGHLEVIKDLEENKYPQLLQWKVPNTNITIRKVESGPRKGEYLFSEKTMEQLNDYYQHMAPKDYKPNAEVTKGFYLFYVSTPGLLMPPKWSHFLPLWSHQMIFSQTIWQIISFGLCTFLLFFLIWVLHRLIIVRSFGKSDIWRYWSRFLFVFLLLILVSEYYRFLNQEINITGNLLIILKISTDALYWILMGIAGFQFLVAAMETVLVSGRAKAIELESKYLRAIFRVIFLIVSLFIIIYGFSEIGVSIIPLITGAGIGGIAIALAARSTLANIISSFTIYVDKPYRVGDEIKVMEYSGTVETIGIRSTSIRLPSGHLALIPNEKMAASEIENFAHRHFIKRVFNIRIPQGTEPEKIEKAIAIIREVLAVKEGSETNALENPLADNRAINEPDHPPRIFFNDIENHSIVVYYWFHPPNQWDYLEHANWVNMQIAQQLAQAGIQFTTLG